MLKNLIAVFLWLFVIGTAYGQNADTAITYFRTDKQGFTHKMPTIDSADFFRVILPPDAGDVLYNVKDYYVNGKPKLVGKSDQYLTKPANGVIVLQGPCITYFSDGKRETISNYYDGYPDGLSTEYYPNGKIYCHIKYRYKDYANYVDCYDKEGNMIADNGNGHWLEYIFNIPGYAAEGTIKDGRPEGDWKGELTIPEHIKFIYTFSKGKYAGGKGYDAEGKEYPFISTQEPAKFKDGIMVFSGFIQRNIVLPKDSLGRKIKDMIWVTFVVEKDGHLADFKVLDSSNPALAAAALDVLKKCPAWIPRKLFGVPLATKITFPINEEFFIGTTRNGRPIHMLTYDEAIPNIGIFGE